MKSSEATDSLVGLPLRQFPFPVRLRAITIHMCLLIADIKDACIGAYRRIARGLLLQVGHTL